eukprot:EG_transcript_21419
MKKGVGFGEKASQDARFAGKGEAHGGYDRRPPAPRYPAEGEPRYQEEYGHRPGPGKGYSDRLPPPSRPRRDDPPGYWDRDREDHDLDYAYRGKSGGGPRGPPRKGGYDYDAEPGNGPPWGRRLDADRPAAAARDEPRRGKGGRDADWDAGRGKGKGKGGEPDWGPGPALKGGKGEDRDRRRGKGRDRDDPLWAGGDSGDRGDDWGPPRPAGRGGKGDRDWDGGKGHRGVDSDDRGERRRGKGADRGDRGKGWDPLDWEDDRGKGSGWGGREEPRRPRRRDAAHDYDDRDGYGRARARDRGYD